MNVEVDNVTAHIIAQIEDSMERLLEGIKREQKELRDMIASIQPGNVNAGDASVAGELKALSASVEALSANVKEWRESNSEANERLAAEVRALQSKTDSALNRTAVTDAEASMPKSDANQDAAPAAIDRAIEQQLRSISQESEERSKALTDQLDRIARRIDDRLARMGNPTTAGKAPGNQHPDIPATTATEKATELLRETTSETTPGEDASTTTVPEDAVRDLSDRVDELTRKDAQRGRRLWQRI